MGEHSAADREGVGSTPTSGSHTANPAYALFQLAKALRSADAHADPESRDRAERKADKWVSVFTQMLDGSLRVGSRTPFDKIPPWVTLEVVTGGFATGNLLAGGPLREHEVALASSLRLEIDEDDRLSLNRYFLSDEGLSGLFDRLARGTYEISVPEEGAFLVVSWLVHNEHFEKARDLLEQVAPFFSRLRFYPEPRERPQRFGPRVFVQDVNTTVTSLRDSSQSIDRRTKGNHRSLDAALRRACRLVPGNRRRRTSRPRCWPGRCETLSRKRQVPDRRRLAVRDVSR